MKRLPATSLTFLLLAVGHVSAQAPASAPTSQPLVWIAMSQVAGPQILWLPPALDGVEFFQPARVDGQWDVLAGGWKSLHKVTHGTGVSASADLARIAHETGGQVSLVMQAPADFTHTSCLKGLRARQWVMTLCLKAVPGGRGGVQF